MSELYPIEYLTYKFTNISVVVFPLSVLFMCDLSIGDFEEPYVTYDYFVCLNSKDLQTVLQRFTDCEFDPQSIEISFEKELDMSRLHDWEYLDQFFETLDEENQKDMDLPIPIFND